MTVTIPSEGEVLREVSVVLMEHLSPANDRFDAETVATLYEKVSTYQHSLPGDSRTR